MVDIKGWAFAAAFGSAFVVLTVVGNVDTGTALVFSLPLAFVTRKWFHIQPDENNTQTEA